MSFIPDDLTPIDLVVRDATAYVLAVSNDPASTRTAVFQGESPEAWCPVLSTDTLPARVYSFEIAEGFLYLGLGGTSEFGGSAYRVPLPENDL